MAKRPRRPKTQRRDRDRSSEPPPDYEIGYRRPPPDRRWEPGQSGNPKGRPKRDQNLRTVIEEALHETTELREEGRSRFVSKKQALVLSTLNKAVKGDPKARTAFALLRPMTAETPEPTSTEPVTTHDAEIIADFFRRHGVPVESATAPEDEDDKPKKPSGKGTEP
jgi:hypothetical protein